MCVKMEADECPSGGPYAIIVSGAKVEERKLDYHGIGRMLDTSIHVKIDVVQEERRTIQLTRTMQGSTDEYFTFDNSSNELKLIMATGCSLQFAQHCGHQSSLATFLPINAKKQICRIGIQGSIDGNPFHNRCEPYPKSVLLDQNNPTCHIETYEGGQSCCRHQHSLLDKDQDIPWGSQFLEYRLKFRFYFEDYQEASYRKKASHRNLVRLYWQTEAVSVIFHR